MVDLLDEITADIDHDEVKPFGPPLKKLPAIVEQSGPDVVARRRRRPGAGDAQPSVRARPGPVPRPGVSACRPCSRRPGRRRGRPARRADDVLCNVAFDGRRIWSFWAGATAVAERADGAWLVRVARAPRGCTSTASPGDRHPRRPARCVHDDEVRFGTSTGPGDRGRPRRARRWGSTTYGRLVKTFETKDEGQLAPLLDALETVLGPAARGRAWRRSRRTAPCSAPSATAPSSATTTTPTSATSAGTPTRST